MGGRGVFDPGGLDGSSESEQLQILADAGISAEDVDLVVQDLWRREHVRMQAEAVLLREAMEVVDRYADLDDSVPASDRRGKSDRLTTADLTGSRRVLAVAIAQAETAAASEDTDGGVEHVRRVILDRICQWETEGKHADSLRLIEAARRPRGNGIGGGR